MDPISPWLAAIGTLFGLGQQQQASGEAARMAALGERQMNLVEPFARRQFQRREQLFEPVEEEAMERLSGRMRKSPWFADEWLRQSRRLRQPLTLNY